MKVLITQHELITWRGSEMFTVEVANELRKRGHEVAVFCPRIGIPSSLMLAGGTWVKSRLCEIPWTPDVIHGQHPLQAIAALSYFLDVPAIYYCHTVTPWQPVHTRIRKYLVRSESIMPGLETVDSISRDRIAVLPAFVNTKRFSTVRRPVRPFRRALLFGGSRFSPGELRRLEQACRERGMTLEKIGQAYGNPIDRPEELLPNFDLVFAVGRCAAEALACGCAVIPIVPGLAGNLITPENFDDLAFSNFSPRYFSSGSRISMEWLTTEIERYSPETQAAITARVRSTRTLTGAVDQLEAIYNDVVDDYKRNPPNPREGEFAPFLEKLSSTGDLWWDQRGETEKVRADLAAQAEYINILQRHIIDHHQLLSPYFPRVRTTLRMIAWTAAVKGRRYLVQFLRRSQLQRHH
jgi:hypothetical protein